MKVKITKNGDVKIKLSREEAEHLRSHLIEAGMAREDECISYRTEEVCDELDRELANADIRYAF